MTAFRAPTTGIVPTKADTIRERLMPLIEALPADERRAGIAAVNSIGTGRMSRGKALAIVSDIIEARARTEARRRSDRRTDRRRRTLIGCRVPRSYADLVRRAAADRGLSLNKWCHLAIAEALAHHYVADDTEQEANPWYGW